MNPEFVPRFAYEKAEDILDAFAQTQDDVFRRAWQKAKFMATAYAYGDYYDDWPGEDPTNCVLALARGWEELQIAFTGRSEASMAGAVWQLWDTLPGRKTEKSFIRAVKAAWKAAEDATPKEAKRLYLKEHRMAPLFRYVDEIWTPNVLMPNDGIRCRMWWQKDQDVDLSDQDDIMEQLTWLEIADRGLDDTTLMHWGKPIEA